MRELQMATDGSDVAPQFIGLNRKSIDDETASAAEVEVQTADDLDSLDFIAALDAEAQQADTYLAW